MIRGIVIGDQRVLTHFRRIYPRTQAMLADSIERMAVKLARKVKLEKLSGQVLKNRTGTLRRSINYRVEKTDSSVMGIVGSNKEYAAAHEYGFDGDVNVKEHLRWMYKAFGRPVKEPKQIRVRPHTRHMHLPARSFLRSSIEEMAPEIKEKIRQALIKACEL